MVQMVTPVYWKDWQKKRMKNNFEVFVLNADLKQPALKGNRDILKSAAACFGVPKGALEGEFLSFGPKGKPSFKKSNTHFSISHSEGLWACLMGPSCCGIDVQYIKPCNYNKIAGRFFSEKEANYVNENGIEAFFELWTRREAYAKYTGEGFFGPMPDLVDERGKLKDRLVCEDHTVCFEEMVIAENLKATICVDAAYEGKIEIRRDWYYEDYIFIG